MTGTANGDGSGRGPRGGDDGPGGGMDLNTASEAELAALPMVGPDRARVLVRNRPFYDWDQVEQLEGFGNGLIDDLRRGGAHIFSSERS